MSDTVKLIIEIPKDIYERCKDYKLWSYDAETLEGAVAQGIPLDDVKAEIGEETTMSKDEAIKILAAIRSDAIQGTCYVTESSAEALEMAIEALKNNYIGV